jgi:hypothetical protein
VNAFLRVGVWRGRAKISARPRSAILVEPFVPKSGPNRGLREARLVRREASWTAAANKGMPP